MQLSFIRKPSLCIGKTNIEAKKIDGKKLETYRMMITWFQVDYKDKNSHFFKETFILSDISINIAFEVLFLIFSNVEVNFNDRELR